jgi:hypothetical protein
MTVDGCCVGNGSKCQLLHRSIFLPENNTAIDGCCVGNGSKCQLFGDTFLYHLSLKNVHAQLVIIRSIL